MEEKLLRYIANESPPEERKQVEKWIEENKDVRKLYLYLETNWKHSSEKKVDWDIENAWKRISHSAGIEKSLPINENTSNRGSRYEQWRGYRQRKSGFTGPARVAAVVLFMILIPLLILWKSGETGEDEVALREVITTKGQFTRILLSDGSSVLLNAESVVKFPERFTGDTREMWLEGEAYFEVNDEAERSFRVHAYGALIEVLGTSFNINTRLLENGGVNVVVSEGVVSLRSGVESNEQAVIIKKGMMSSWNEKTGVSTPVKIDLQRTLAWVRGELMFDSTPLTEVITQLERRYNIIIKVEDESILHRRLTANYNVEPIDEIIKNVALSVGINYRKENDKIYLLR